MAADDLDDQLDYEFVESEESAGETVDVHPAEAEELSHDKNAETIDQNHESGKAVQDKKAKAKAKQKERKSVKNERDREQKETLALMEPALIADYITKLVSKSNPEISAVELHDNTVPESQIVFTGDVVPVRSSLEGYKPFFEHFGLNKKSKKDLILVLCMSAIRVCEVVRALRSTNKGGALKLIKQNKPEYDKRCLKSPAHIAVSTPGRIFKLQELKILDSKRIKQVVVDTSILDAKQRTVWDIEGTVKLVSELAHKNKAKIYLY